MATHIVHPDRPLRPAELDRLLENGWRPTGQAVYTSDYLRTDDDELHGCLQIRLPLREFEFKKRQRKLLRRNRERFTTTLGPAGLPDDELLGVNERYMELYPHKSRIDLEYNVTNDNGNKPLDTWILRIREGRRLVAFSYFDLGQRVIYTKSGIYDPEYARDSLGLYTMLLEIELAVNRGFHYYYPGYFSPTYPAFDYKKRLGCMEYREVASGQWMPLPDDPEHAPEDPLAVNRQKLLELAAITNYPRTQATLMEYPSFTGRFRPSPTGENHMLDAPLLLYIDGEETMGTFSVVTYHNESNKYRLNEARSAHLYDMRVRPYGQDGTPRFTTPVVVMRVRLETPSITRMAHQIRRHRGRGIGKL